ncbi:hypothetical protein JTE90_009590 [Oedothorax gibbosus]|uniref:PH domain-containing protein n=1 Tax=Oedothorax gibbosus TaxID=931172 RepID=A0AAV6VK01_9ARAC|nr:hypothetical protein JTE90_009590 [Oedothorax gibbosus]
MGCCDESSVQVSKMALELKSGPMLWHKRRFFGSNWRDVHSVLYNDSSLLWYRDKSRQEQDGGLVLKDAPELIAFGPYTAQVPNRPELPDNYEQKEMLAFGVRGKDVVYWFLCPNEEEVGSWMAAIASSMPAPPAPPPQHGMGTAPPPQHGMGNAPQNGMVPTQASAPQYQPQQPPPQYTPNRQAPAYHQGTPGIPGQYPPPAPYRPPTYQNAIHPTPQPYANPYPAGGGAPTTVIVQQDRPGYIGGGGGGDFAMGMLLGGAIGTAWGSHSHHGFGFGGGFGYGGGWGGHGHGGTSIHDHTNLTVNNYYDNDTTTVNNNLDMTNNVAIEQGDVPQMPPVEEPVPEPIMEHYVPPQPYMEQEAFPQPVPFMAEEYAPVQEYVPMEDTSGGMFGGGEDYGGGDYGGGDYDLDFGGGDFGDF